VLGTPLMTDDAAYVSLGTWALVGPELDGPVLSEAARPGGFTNEGGVDGTVRFLTNVMGTWLLSESLRG
jgi:rhamnulokinase